MQKGAKSPWLKAMTLNKQESRPFSYKRPIRSQKPTLNFAAWIDKLPNRWEEVSNNNGSYLID